MKEEGFGVPKEGNVRRKVKGSSLGLGKAIAFINGVHHISQPARRPSCRFILGSDSEQAWGGGLETGEVPGAREDGVALPAARAR